MTPYHPNLINLTNTPPGPSHPPDLTSGSVGNNGHSQVDLPWVGVGGGADGVVARREKGKLGQQQGGGHLDGGELFQNFHKGGGVVRRPLLILLQTLRTRRGGGRGGEGGGGEGGEGGGRGGEGGGGGGGGGRRRRRGEEEEGERE